MQFPSTCKRTAKSIATRATALTLTCVLAVASIPAAPLSALADVRRGDVVLGLTVDSRGLSVAQCPNIDAQSAIILGQDGVVYYERDAHSERKIASVTKIMTAVVALENGAKDKPITVSDRAAAIGESSAGLVSGDQLTLTDAVKALMVPSGNDAAQALAECVGSQLIGEDRPSQEGYNAFIGAMNKKAAQLGMDNTYYANPHGLDDEEFEDTHHATASDIAKLVAHAMTIKEFRESVNKEEEKIQVTRQGDDGGEKVEITLTSTDFFLTDYEGACGVKTGFTDAAGPCFASAVNRDGKEYYGVVLNSSNEYQRFYDTENMFDWVYQHVKQYQLISGNSNADDGTGRSVPIIGYAPHADWTDKTYPVTLANPEESIEVFDISGNISQDVEFFNLGGSIRQGQVVGKVRYIQRNETLATYDVVAAAACEAPGPLEAVGIFFTRAFSFLTGAKTVADPLITNEMILLNDKTTTVL